MYAVFATTPDHQRVLVSDHTPSYGVALGSWKRMDDLRLDGRFPHVKFFEVRSTDDPGYADAPVSLLHSEPLPRSRGFRNYRDAARRAWRMWQGDRTPHGSPQGTGGWFYWGNGRTAAQGLGDLERLCRNRGLVVQGVDGRYYPAVTNL
jgi:hypothetical protein